MVAPSWICPKFDPFRVTPFRICPKRGPFRVVLSWIYPKRGPFRSIRDIARKNEAREGAIFEKRSKMSLVKGPFFG